MVDKAGSGNHKWLKFVLFALLLAIFQVQTLAKAETFDTGLFHEVLINGNYTEWRVTYFPSNAANFTCSLRLTSDYEKQYWDFQLKVWTGSVNRQLPVDLRQFLITNKIGDSYVAEIPCVIYNMPPPPNTEILQTFKYTGGSKMLTDEWVYPFDKYKSFTTFPPNMTMRYKAKLTLPENTVPVADSVYISYKGERKTAYPFIEEQRLSFIYQELKIYQEDVRDKQIVTVVAQWERPMLVKFLFIVSLVSILVLTLLFIRSKEFKTSDYLAHSFTIFALQEGINQLVIPAGRPLGITLFESPIIVVIFVVLYRHIQIKRKMMLRERMSEDGIRTPLFRI